MLAMEVLLCFLAVFSPHIWLLRTSIRLLLSSSITFWITATAIGAYLLYNGFPLIKDDASEDDTEEKEKDVSKDSVVDEGEEESEEESKKESEDEG